MKKKFICMLSLVMMLMLQSGCWDKIELNDITVATGLAVDKGKDKRYRLTIEAVNPTEFKKGGGEGNAAAVLFSLEENTISELTNKMNVGISRKLVFSHTRALYISEEIAREGLLDFLDFLDRSGEFRNDFNIFVAKGSKAADFLGMTYPFQKVPSLKTHKQAEMILQDWGGDPHIRLTDFVDSLTTHSRHAVIAAVSIQGDPKKGKKTANNKSLEPAALIVMDGMAVFKYDKMIGYMSLKDTRNYLWTQELQRTSLSVPCSPKDSGNKNGNFMDIRIVNTAADLDAKYRNSTPEFIVNINGEARLHGTSCAEDLRKIKTYQDFEKKIEKQVEKMVRGTIVKTQKKYKIDIFGFGEVMNRQNHKQYVKVEDHWDQEFSRAKINVNAQIFLRRAGIRNESYITEMQKIKNK